MTVLLDGGMGVELTARGFNADAKVAGHALIESPSVICDVHREFIAAGAEVITTWNYAITPYRLALSDLRGRLGEITRIAVEMANEARGGKAGVRVAGSLPPLRASYEPNTQDPASMAEEYAEIAGHLAPGVDLFICETMASAGEARAAAGAAQGHGKPVWVSWTLRDECDGLLRSGETVDAALAALDGIAVEAVLFNCCDAAAITDAMPHLRAKTKRTIGAYANALMPIAKDWKRDGNVLREFRDVTPEDYAHIVGQWRAAGAEIVGGCCGIGPDHIARLREELSREG
ncbi:MAG: homocysteine S-methyltransferase family protein [Rhodospirillales bacterium]|jgi:S-methylmethionine-dependent homocysteine/selenocysteine methylase|nr:homocysteine S-methyltransferase family protein [Rhodospirillales bacterium]MDP6884037.1 homocysteine S-methyltransferase family protein [Rhodospirillales bacterium]